MVLYGPIHLNLQNNLSHPTWFKQTTAFGVSFIFHVTLLIHIESHSQLSDLGFFLPPLLFQSLLFSFYQCSLCVFFFLFYVPPCICISLNAPLLTWFLFSLQIWIN
ncbi:hypothetical protein ERO13_D09G196250v2 [Gossypium hirsutum]|uniref:Uncharacterized protein n=3 Tax=Gossypium TaxID=3633 RepID=A0A5J5QBM7_GOSBA|nr:hypothetical protein ES319_D09G216600v1 [Gossypium barbadense]KAG4131285.1 hypothetical protein ERO13_D09G196250v2 [Gossypium hirsutum]TYG55002.1 hypothetical protein ES288_D09G236700v1 [Gossypium darwinii]TYH55405.1 hypothetical protein ES332_D09G233000v1 [Gossypium tomentosum]